MEFTQNYSSSIGRKSVATPDNVEFVNGPKKKPRTVNNEKNGFWDERVLKFFRKILWAFGGIMVLRLLFAGGGVTDYFSKRSDYSKFQSSLQLVKNENMNLVLEIERMRKDPIYQRKMVRDNLGFISGDEYLILFPTEVDQKP